MEADALALPALHYANGFASRLLQPWHCHCLAQLRAAAPDTFIQLRECMRASVLLSLVLSLQVLQDANSFYLVMEYCNGKEQHSLPFVRQRC